MDDVVLASDNEASRGEGRSVPANWFSREDALEGAGQQSAKAAFDPASLKMYLYLFLHIVK